VVVVDSTTLALLLGCTRGLGLLTALSIGVLPYRRRWSWTSWGWCVSLLSLLWTELLTLQRRLLSCWELRRPGLRTRY